MRRRVASDCDREVAGEWYRCLAGRWASRTGADLILGNPSGGATAGCEVSHVRVRNGWMASTGKRVVRKRETVWEELSSAWDSCLND